MGRIGSHFAMPARPEQGHCGLPVIDGCRYHVRLSKAVRSIEAMTIQYPTIADCVGNTPLVRLQRLPG